MKKLLLAICAIAFCSCDGATGKPKAQDPVERGLSYVAAAIVTAAIIRAIFNK
jgi:hypothetical protein